MIKANRYVNELIGTLVKLKHITLDDAEPLKKAFQDSDHAVFDEFLLEEGIVEAEDLLKAKSIYYQVPLFDVVGHFFETPLLHLFPEDFLKRNAIIPLEADEDSMVLIANDPSMSNLLPDIGEYVSYDIHFYVGLYTDIYDAIEEFYDTALTQEPLDSDLREEHLLMREEKIVELDDDPDAFSIIEEEDLN